MHSEKKKRQHFVWRKYLRKWARNEKIFCLMGENIFETDLMNIGQENYFYKLKELTDNDLFLLTSMINKMENPLIQILNHGWIELFNQVFAIKRGLEKKGISNPEIKNKIDALICNFEEDIHCRIESSADNLLELLYCKDLTFYHDDEKWTTFLFFICTQYSRTQNIRDNSEKALEICINHYQKIQNDFSFNIEAILPVWRLISATNLGATLAHDRDNFRPILIENKSSLPFVTGDQPVINTYAVGLNHVTPPNELELYYPLTPELALLLTSKEEYRTQPIYTAQESEIIEYNRFIHDLSGKQIYASSRDILESMLSA